MRNSVHLSAHVLQRCGNYHVAVNTSAAVLLMDVVFTCFVRERSGAEGVIEEGQSTFFFELENFNQVKKKREEKKKQKRNNFLKKGINSNTLIKWLYIRVGVRHMAEGC